MHGLGYGFECIGPFDYDAMGAADFNGVQVVLEVVAHGPIRDDGIDVFYVRCCDRAQGQLYNLYGVGRYRFVHVG